ncbi:hypothetical protein BP5796_02940 [Coleophoma crateriformis]|uniref:NADP-dependent oxidoreductase domain-containing protein n=1 Tax=Coleophoma crateriformis TaxID=565419 RepID=A0A3D8SLU3_9HELO|nr:hypothetical protein BP5796_02940 [Coleophoma crateriformis]
MANLNLQSKYKMKSGYEIPVLGYGVWQTPNDVCEAVVKESFAVGYRHVDSAAGYYNEAPCGLAIRTSDIPRDQIFFTSKVPTNGLSYESAQRQVVKTLKESGLDYVDLMFIHAPYGGSAIRKGAWKALVEAQEEGKIRSLGVSNYGVHHLDELEQHIKELEAERGPGKGGVVSVGQWELHPWLARKDITDWCFARGIIVEAYSPLVRGQRLDDELLKPIVKRTGKTPAQVLLRWSLQKGFVPLPKTVTKERIAENAQLYDFELTEEEMKKLDTGDYTPVCWDPATSPLDK